MAENDPSRAAAADGRFARSCDLHCVVALLFTGDGRYLMQLRDDLPTVNMAGNWGLFGDWSEPGESAEQAMRRELVEELDFVPDGLDWFTEMAYLVPGVGRSPLHKTFFAAPIVPADRDRMTLQEGVEMCLFAALDLLALPNVVPWDVYGLTVHARRHEIPRLNRNPSGPGIP